MKREFLKEMGLGEEVVNKIMAEYGKDVESHKAKATELEAEKNSLADKNKEYEKTVKELSKNNADNEELNKTITELRESIKTKDTEHSNYKNGVLLDNALNGHKPKNLKALKSLLDNDLIKYDGDRVLGLDEQIKNLKESDSYLFETEEKPAEEGQKGFQAVGSTGGENRALSDVDQALARHGLLETK